MRRDSVGGGLWDGGPQGGGPLSLTAGGDELRGDEGRGAVLLPGEAPRRRIPYKTASPSRAPPPPDPLSATPRCPAGRDPSDADPPLPPSPPSSPCPPSSSPRPRRHSAHSWKPHRAQLQWRLKKRRWHKSQRRGGPSRHLQAVTPAATRRSAPPPPPTAPISQPGSQSGPPPLCTPIPQPPVPQTLSRGPPSPQTPIPRVLTSPLCTPILTDPHPNEPPSPQTPIPRC